MQETSRILFGQRWEVKEPGNLIHIEQMNFLGPARHAHGDDGNTGEVRVPLPRLERHGGQQIVFTKHDVGTLLTGCIDRIGDAHDAGGVDA